MRRSLLAAALTLVLLTWPAHAQLIPTGQPAPSERVLIDATFRAIPPADSAPCMALDRGTLTVTASATGEGTPRPVTFHLNGYRGQDPGASIALSVNSQPVAVSAPLQGDAYYCWSVVVDAPVRHDDGMATRTNYAQVVSLRMTHAAP